jgi:hypothetical protein
MKPVTKIIVGCLLFIGLSIAPTSKSQAQVEIILDIIKAAIKAADIAVQKVQNATIDLQNAQRELENALSESELGDIAGWVEKQKDLYQDYFKELWEVKTIISEYKQVSDIITKQKQLVADYKKAYTLVQQDKHFTATELSYIYSVYSGIINESTKDLDQLLTIVESFTVQMSDEQRLKIITVCAANIEREISDLTKFNNQSFLISIQRSKDQADLASIRQLYGL